MGKLCEKKGTAKGMIADYMKHLKLHHNYSSLKMKYQQEEYPFLTRPQNLGDGFGHMIEKEEEDEIVLDNTEDANNSQLDAKNLRIAELEAQISDQNLLKQKLTETRARLEQVSKAKTCDIPRDFFEYDEATDEVKTIDEAAFDQFVDKKCVEQNKIELRRKLK